MLQDTAYVAKETIMGYLAKASYAGVLISLNFKFK